MKLVMNEGSTWALLSSKLPDWPKEHPAHTINASNTRSLRTGWNLIAVYCLLGQSAAWLGVDRRPGRGSLGQRLQRLGRCEQPDTASLKPVP